MPNILIRHPSWTNVIREDGGISLEWSAYFSMADNVVNSMSQVPKEDLNNLPSTLSGLQQVVDDSDYDTLAAMIEALQHRVETLEAYVTEMLLVMDNPTCTVASLPPVAYDPDHPHIGNIGRTVMVTDEAGGATLAFSDATNWRRVQDRAVVS
jgi:hypothetical protein